MSTVKNMKRLSGLASRLTITFLSLALISGVARGAVFTVNTPADTNNPGACISPGPCSFREAINASNKSKLVRDSIVFDPAVFQYPGDIFNSGGTTVQLSSELPAIINSVDIDGGSTTISGWLDPRYYPISDNGLGGHIPYVDEDGNPRLDGSGNIRYRYNYDYSSSSNLSDSTGGCTLHPTLRVLGPRYSGVAHSNADGTTIKHLIFYDGVFGGSSAAVRPCANVLIQGAKNVEISASSFIATAFNFQPGIGIFERGGYGINVFDSDNTIITDNYFFLLFSGVHNVGTRGSQIFANFFDTNAVAAYLRVGDSNEMIKNNTFESTDPDFIADFAVVVDRDGKQISVIDNTFVNNQGVLISSGKGHLVKGNTMTLGRSPQAEISLKQSWTGIAMIDRDFEFPCVNKSNKPSKGCTCKIETHYNNVCDVVYKEKICRLAPKTFLPQDSRIEDNFIAGFSAGIALGGLGNTASRNEILLPAMYPLTPLEDYTANQIRYSVNSFGISLKGRSDRINTGGNIVEENKIEAMSGDVTGTYGIHTLGGVKKSIIKDNSLMNLSAGIQIIDDFFGDNVDIDIYGNIIGTDPETKTLDRGIAGSGIFISTSSTKTNRTVSEDIRIFGNTIAYTGKGVTGSLSVPSGAGAVVVASGYFNLAEPKPFEGCGTPPPPPTPRFPLVGSPQKVNLSGNSIYANNGPGIDLSSAVYSWGEVKQNGDPSTLDYFVGVQDLRVAVAAGDGVTNNDEPQRDADLGPNNLQNFPVLNTAQYNQGRIAISANLVSEPRSAYHLEFFLNAGTTREGKIYVGSVNVNTNNQGSVAITKTFNVPAGAANGMYLTSTATKIIRSGGYAAPSVGSTSEFSAPIAVGGSL